MAHPAHRDLMDNLDQEEMPDHRALKDPLDLMANQAETVSPDLLAQLDPTGRGETGVNKDPLDLQDPKDLLDHRDNLDPVVNLEPEVNLALMDNLAEMARRAHLAQGENPDQLDPADNPAVLDHRFVCFTCVRLLSYVRSPLKLMKMQGC